MPTPWVFDELGHAGEEHLDAAYAARYDRKANFDPSPDLAHLRSLGLDSTKSLIDLGAGTGTFALAAAPLCRRVVAVDISKSMLGVLEERAATCRARNIEAVQAGFLTYGHEGPQVDFVYSRNALHHLPDFWKAIALRRVATWLRPGGVFLLRDLVYSFDPQDANGVIESWLARASLEAADGYTASDLATHVSSEYSTYSWLLEPMLQRAAFDIREAEYPFHVFAAYTCVKR